MPVSNEAFLAAFQNIPPAINAWITNQNNLSGTLNFYNLTAATLVKASAGRIVNVSVMVAGSASGTIYDAATVTDLSRPIYLIPHSAAGLFNVNLPCSYGILIVPGTGQTVAGSYS